MTAYLLAYRAAHKTAYIATSFLPYAGLFIICRGFFDHFPGPAVFLGYVAALLLGFLIGFFFETCMGMVGFWFLEVTSLLWVVNTVNYFVSGQMFPLDLLSPFWGAVLKAMPFQYLAYFPAVIFLGKVEGPELIQGLLIESAWVLALIALARWLYRRGLRQYSAFGG
jgi:ABC-2 type transport system permease protein